MVQGQTGGNEWTGTINASHDDNIDNDFLGNMELVMIDQSAIAMFWISIIIKV